MKIAGYLEESQSDYPGKTSSVVFTPGCNYNCPACYNKTLLKMDEIINPNKIFKYLDKGEGWIDGVVLCGGEPTLQEGLKEFAQAIKSRNLAVKLDTNGSNPKALRNLLKSGCIDYVAMDVKAPKNLYDKVAGVKVDLDNIEESMKTVQNFPHHEFRTTVVPVIRGENNISYLNKDEISNLAKWIVDVTGHDSHKYYLQKYVCKKGEMVDKRLDDIENTPMPLMEELKEAALEHLPNADIR